MKGPEEKFDAVVVTSIQGPIFPDADEGLEDRSFESNVFFPESQQSYPLDFGSWRHRSSITPEERAKLCAPEIAAVILEGRVKLVISIDSPGGRNYSIRMAEKTMELVRENRGEVHTYGFNEISSAAAFIWGFGDYRYVLGDTKAMWHVSSVDPVPTEVMLRDQILTSLDFPVLEDDELERVIQEHLANGVTLDPELEAEYRDFEEIHRVKAEGENRNDMLKTFEGVSKKALKAIRKKIFDPDNPMSEIKFTGAELKRLRVANRAFTGLKPALRHFRRNVGITRVWESVGLERFYLPYSWELLRENLGM